MERKGKTVDRGRREPDWFVAYPLKDDIYLIDEPGQVASFLVVGNERSALIDTGLGIGNIRKVMERFTDHEAIVINTHAHLDHIGGNYQFSKVAIHEAEGTHLEKEFRMTFWDVSCESPVSSVLYPKVSILPVIALFPPKLLAFSGMETRLIWAGGSCGYFTPQAIPLEVSVYLKRSEESFFQEIQFIKEF